MRRPAGAAILALLFVLISVPHLIQGVGELSGVDDVPWPLAAFHVASAVLGFAAAVGSWRRARWASLVAAAWTVVTAMLVATLGPLLALPPEARGGLWAGAGAIAAMGAAAAWYLHRLASPRVAAAAR